MEADHSSQFQVKAEIEQTNESLGHNVSPPSFEEVNVKMEPKAEIVEELSEAGQITVTAEKSVAMEVDSDAGNGVAVTSFSQPSMKNSTVSTVGFDDVSGEEAARSKIKAEVASTSKKDEPSNIVPLLSPRSRAERVSAGREVLPGLADTEREEGGKKRQEVISSKVVSAKRSGLDITPSSTVERKQEKSEGTEKDGTSRINGAAQKNSSSKSSCEAPGTSRCDNERIVSEEKKSVERVKSHSHAASPLQSPAKVCPFSNDFSRSFSSYLLPIFSYCLGIFYY